MRGNHWGKAWGITTFGESHGPAIGVVIEDVKPGIDFPMAAIQTALDRRRPGTGMFTSTRQEQDKIVVISGVFDGKTTGMPICLLVYNTDQQSGNYDVLKELFRPGHADFSYFQKFKIFDYRGGGRASGRETISRVAAAALVSDIIRPMQISFLTLRIGQIESQTVDETFAANNSLFWPCKITYDRVIEYLTKVKSHNDSVGSVVQVRISNSIPGLGDPVFEKLDANLAKALISIGGVKGVEFGEGFKLGSMLGSEANDQLKTLDLAKSESKAGGIYGGVSSGEIISFRFVIKPTPSICRQQKTVDRGGRVRELVLEGRFDTCLVPRLIPVAEAMIKLVLADAVSYQRMLTGTEAGISDLREMLDKIDEDIIISLAKRKRVSDKVKALKGVTGEELYQPCREREIFSRLAGMADQFGLSKRLVEGIWQLIFCDNRGEQ